MNELTLGRPRVRLLAPLVVSLLPSENYACMCMLLNFQFVDTTYDYIKKAGTTYKLSFALTNIHMSFNLWDMMF